ncbi:MAG: hypothetical protein V1873_08595 [Verrucomicrobiota bacterium]
MPIAATVRSRECRSLSTAALVACVLLPPCLAVAQAPAAADPSQNAALFYWKAIALEQVPETAEQVELVRFVDRELEPLPPRVFAAEPEALRWLINERPMLTALNQGARRTACAFPIRTPRDVALDLSHIPRLRLLSVRALAAAKAYEYADNTQGAATIYVDLLRMTKQLDQDNNLTSGLFGAELLQKLLWELEGFLSRVQPGDSVALLSREFKDNRPALFRVGNYLREEAQRYGEWLLADADRAAERLNRLYGNAANRPAVEQLVTLEAKKKEERLRTWVDDYRKRMKSLADAMELPYASALPRVRGLDAQKLAAQRDAGGGNNPLIPLLVPDAAELYERLMLAEGHYGMIDILAQAALFRADLGAWPASLAELAQFARRSLPKDPFSGEDFYYKLDGDRPELALRIPRKMASAKGFLYTINLDRRRAGDEQRLSEAMKTIAQERRENPNAPVPMR